MKKILALLLVMMFLFVMTACENGEETNDNSTISSSTNNESDNFDMNEYNSEIIINEEKETQNQFPTIEQYISNLKSSLQEGSVGEGEIINGKYEFYLSDMIKVGLILNENNEVVNAAFLSSGSLNNFANDVIYTMGIGVELMKPLFTYCEKEDFDSEKVIKEIYSKINKEIEKNNYKPDFNVEYKYGDCNFTMSSVDLGSSIQFIVGTGYKMD